MSFQREGDRITLTVSVEDWDLLLMRLGYAAGALYRDGRDEMARETIRLTNRLNEGNPHFRPYEVRERETEPA